MSKRTPAKTTEAAIKKTPEIPKSKSKNSNNNPNNNNNNNANNNSNTHPSPKSPKKTTPSKEKSSQGVSLIFLVLGLIGGVLLYPLLHKVLCDEPSTSPYNVEPLPRRFVEVLDSQMAYVDEGPYDKTDVKTSTLVFLHGNPTSSYLWRNIIRELAPTYRCVAPDLIGMGSSFQLPGTGDERYRFVEHRRYLDEFLAKVVGSDQKDIILVIHDWGSALGFDWAFRNQNRVRGIAYMEAIVKPLSFSLSRMPFTLSTFFRAMRTPYLGEALVLWGNFFVEYTLPSLIIRKLSVTEKEYYRRPYIIPGESRRPLLTFPREIPGDGHPADVVEIVTQYSEWLPKTYGIPKLLVRADPGCLLIRSELEFAQSFPNQMEVAVKGRHYIQEDAPIEIAQYIQKWLTKSNISHL